MQTISGDLATLLKARLQAGASGFRGRVEIGSPGAAFAPVTVTYGDTFNRANTASQSQGYGPYTPPAIIVPASGVETDVTSCSVYGTLPSLTVQWSVDVSMDDYTIGVDDTIEVTIRRGSGGAILDSAIVTFGVAPSASGADAVGSGSFVDSAPGANPAYWLSITAGNATGNVWAMAYMVNIVEATGPGAISDPPPGGPPVEWPGGGVILDGTLMVFYGANLPVSLPVLPVTISLDRPNVVSWSGDGTESIFRCGFYAAIAGTDQWITVRWYEEQDSGSPSGYALTTIEIQGAGGYIDDVAVPYQIGAYPYAVTCEITTAGVTLTVDGHVLVLDAASTWGTYTPAGITSFGPSTFEGPAWSMDNLVLSGSQPQPLAAPKRIGIDKSLRMTSDQAEVEFANEDLPFGWGPSSLFVTNSRIRIFQWYGDPANEVRTFTGLIDRVGDSRDPLTTSVTCRDMMALLIDGSFSATAPQGAAETGAVRTPANGVYLSMEVAAIVADILDRAGYPAADRAITATGYVPAEYVIADGTSWADAIIGADKLAGLVGYAAWADELGIFHFEPAPVQSVTAPTDPVYTFRTGEDITNLADGTDQYDLRTRVKVRGPLTVTTLTDTWREQWRTAKIKYPVGIWYDPADAGYIRVLDLGTKRLYRMAEVGRVLVSSVYLGGAIPYPLGISGDPSDATIYWVLSARWRYDGVSGSNTIKKVRKSDNVVLASYALASGQWSDLKVTASYIWLTNISTDQIHKHSKADGSPIASYSHVYGGVTQANPGGLMVDGTTLHVFWTNAGTTARFLVCDETTPTVIDKVVATTGTALVGGEINTTSHTECWGSSDVLGLVAKFVLALAVDSTVEVFAEVADSPLEDELGELALLDPRIHDTHPLDAAHAYEIRRDTVSLAVVISLAQATETAMRRLDGLAARRRVLDAGILGNPALQKIDLVRVEDPVTGIATDFLIDTYRTEMTADGTYLGTLALLPLTLPGDAPTDLGSAT